LHKTQALEKKYQESTMQQYLD